MHPSAKPSAAEIEEKLKKIFCDKFEGLVTANELGPETNLVKDLNLDSLDITDALMRAETEFNVDLDGVFSGGETNRADNLPEGGITFAELVKEINRQINSE